MKYVILVLDRQNHVLSFAFARTRLQVDDLVRKAGQGAKDVRVLACRILGPIRRPDLAEQKKPDYQELWTIAVGESFLLPLANAIISSTGHKVLNTTFYRRLTQIKFEFPGRTFKTRRVEDGWRCTRLT